MRHFKYLLSILTFIYFSCESPDTTPPEVTITSPVNGSTVSEIVTITGMATDNDVIKSVGLWVDGAQQNAIDETEPYSLKWNTTIYEDESTHIIVFRATDNSGNMADSDPINLKVDNTNSYPIPVDIQSITLTGDSLVISWPESAETDFLHYSLEKSSESDMNNFSVIFVTSDRTETLFTEVGVNPTRVSYYRISVLDTLGYESKGNITSSPTDPAPQKPVIKNIFYDQLNQGFAITWYKNTDADFQYYKLEEDTDLEFDNPSVIFISTEQADTSFFRDNVAEEEQLYYRIWVADRWDQLRASDKIGGSSFLKIAFISQNKLATVNPDGSTAGIIDPNFAVHPSWSSDGQWIVYKTSSDGIRRVRGNGSESELIFSTSNEWIGYPRFSLDGSRVYFQTTGKILSFNVDGTDYKEHWVSPENIQDFDLSPDGLLLAVGTYDDEPKIYVGNSDGSEMQDIGFRGREPEWSPNTQEIVFSDYESRNICKYSIINQDTTRLTSNAGNFRKPEWSPDGTKIVFEQNAGPGVGIVDADGTNEITIPIESAFSPKWSGSGEYIVCFSDKDIYLIEATSGNLTQLTNGMDAEYPVFQPQFPSRP